MLISVSSHAVVLERFIEAVKPDAVVTSLNENFSLSSKLSSASLETLEKAKLKHNPISLICDDQNWILEAVDLHTGIDADALQLALRAESAAKPPLPIQRPNP